MEAVVRELSREHTALASQASLISLILTCCTSSITSFAHTRSMWRRAQARMRTEACEAASRAVREEHAALTSRVEEVEARAEAALALEAGVG